jgi:hypothetical protein
VDAEKFFEELLYQCHKYQNEGLLLIGGDFNARCADDSEFIEGVDKVKPRHVIDFENNKNGEYLVDFMLSTNTCMLNGRLGRNNFTSVSAKGKAVVDYAMVPYEQFEYYKDFDVQTMTEVTNEYELAIPPLTKMSDHSILICSIDETVWKVEDKKHFNSDRYENTTKRYRVKNMAKDFMKNENIKPMIENAMQRIQLSLEEEDDVNKAGEELINLLHAEMNIQLDEVKSNKSHFKKNTKLKQKPWWDDVLQTLWNEVCKREKVYLQSDKRGHHKQHLRSSFIQARKDFNRSCRLAKRRYQRIQQEELGDLCENDSVGFWRKINNMSVGSQRASVIPLTVELDGNLTSDLDNVMHKWKTDFSDLFSAPNSLHFNNDHLKLVEDRLTDIKALQAALPALPVEITHVLNEPLTLPEVKKAIYKLKK